jgi:hypothetical protein
LRQEVGDGEFGFRAQGLLAHVLLRLGARITVINAQGHPDIEALFGEQHLVIEVEITRLTGRDHVLKADDLASICPRARGMTGYLAILDCVLPVKWLLVNHNRLRYRSLGVISLSTVRAVSDKALSEECTREFAKLILECEDRLENLTFHLLAARALSGEPV